jgi:hypothetical protein
MWRAATKPRWRCSKVAEKTDNWMRDDQDEGAVMVLW